MDIVFTIGHSNHEITDLVALIKKHKVDMILDVRNITKRNSAWFCSLIRLIIKALGSGLGRGSQILNTILPRVGCITALMQNPALLPMESIVLINASFRDIARLYSVVKRTPLIVIGPSW